MSKLVEIAMKKKGLVEDCPMVLNKSEEYRADQDYLLEFTKDNIVKEAGSKIKPTELRETFKQWYSLQYGKSVPQGRELFKYMDKTFGKRVKTAWQGVAINYENDEEEVDDI